MNRRIWEFLPARRSRGRVTTPSVIAANIGASVVEVMAALLTMERDGHVVQDKRGSWHRGVPLLPSAPTRPLLTSRRRGGDD